MGWGIGRGWELGIVNEGALPTISLIILVGGRFTSNYGSGADAIGFTFVDGSHFFLMIQVLIRRKGLWIGMRG